MKKVWLCIIASETSHSLIPLLIFPVPYLNPYFKLLPSNTVPHKVRFTPFHASSSWLPLAMSSLCIEKPRSMMDRCCGREECDNNEELQEVSVPDNSSLMPPSLAIDHNDRTWLMRPKCCRASRIWCHWGSPRVSQQKSARKERWKKE